MPRPKSARSDTSDGDAEGVAERVMDLNKLQRQYRLMNVDRLAYGQETQETIMRQKAEIASLEAEREAILTDLCLQESKSNQIRDQMCGEKLVTLADEKAKLDEECKEEKMQQEELNAQIREQRANIRQQHAKMGGIHMSSQHNVRIQKRISKLENQLQQDNTKFSNALKVNKQLREEIDSLQGERRRFIRLKEKLIKEHESLKREIGGVIDQAQQAHDAREEANAKMILLKEKSDKDFAQHNTEMKDLLRIIDHVRKLKEFMTTKGKERQEDPQQVEWRHRKEEKEAERKKESQVDSVESYEAAFERIKELSGEEDIDLLVESFIKVEDRNFALYNYVNEQNHEIEMLQDQIDEIRRDIEKFESQGVELEAQRKSILKHLEEKQTHSSKLADEYDEKFTGVMKILDQLRAGIESLFNKINCERTAIDDMLGAQTGVTDQNMKQYLGIIEQRTNQLLLIQAYSSKQKDYEEYIRKPPTLLGEGPHPQAQPPHILPPTIGDEYDSEGSEPSDDDGRPFTRNELQAKVMKTVKKRESAARREGFRYDLSDAREKTKGKGKGTKH